MKKEKGKEKEGLHIDNSLVVMSPKKFTPESIKQSYDYLDNLPTGGYIWEFMRRNANYINFRHRHMDINDKSNIPPASENEKKQINDEYRKNYWPMPLLSPGQKASKGLFSHINFSSPVVINLGITTDNVDQIFQNYRGQKSALMALIDISTHLSADELLASIKPAIVFWRKKLGLPKARKAKTPKKKMKNFLINNGSIWKSYLIVYDLHEAGLEFKEISNLLSKIDSTYGDDNTVRRHYKAAKKLINDGYKEYLQNLLK